MSPYQNKEYSIDRCCSHFWCGGYDRLSSEIVHGSEDIVVFATEVS